MKKANFIIEAEPLVAAQLAQLEDAPDPVNDRELRPFEVPADHHGMRLDRSLALLLPEFSRSYLQQLIAADAVIVNAQVARKAASKVLVDDVGTIELRATAQSRAFTPEAMDLDVVFEDEHLLVINKPAGLVVHPAPGNWSGTLLNGLLARDPNIAELPRAGIVHRLDKDTSGLMVVARNRRTMDALVGLIARREVSRQYFALVHGKWTGPAQRLIDAPIGRDPRNRLRMSVVDLSAHSGKAAQTEISFVVSTDKASWLRCTLRTGRTHQIRVHLASIGHPIAGDLTYGGAPGSGIGRQALHAWRLRFVHPATGTELDFRAELAPDIRALLAAWGLRYNEPTSNEC